LSGTETKETARYYERDGKVEAEDEARNRDPTGFFGQFILHREPQEQSQQHPLDCRKPRRKASCF
jgi:hypothetical protein